MSTTQTKPAPTTNDQPIPRPILAAWLAMVTRGDLAAILTNCSDSSYAETTNALGLKGDILTQWKNIVSSQSWQNYCGILDAAVSLWHDVVYPTWPTPDCPPDSQLNSIGNNTSDPVLAKATTAQSGT